MLDSVTSAGKKAASQSGTSGSIGLLIDVAGDYFTARLDSPGGATAGSGAADVSSASSSRVGTYMKVCGDGRDILVMVERSYLVAGKQGGAVNMAQLTPLGEIDAAGNFNRGLSQYPSCGAEVQFIDQDSLNSIFSAYGDAEFRVGHLTSEDAIDIHLDASAFFGRHAAILGQSGSGKSWTVTSLIQATLRCMPKAHIILLDMHGEYGDKQLEGLVAHAPFPSHLVRSFKAEDLEFPYWLLSFSEFCELLVNPGDEHASTQTAFLRNTMISHRKAANEHLDLGHITVDSPLYYSLEELAREIEDANEATTDFGKTRLPTYGQFDQLLVRLGSLLNDNRYDFLMRPKYRNSSESLPELMMDLVGLGNPRASVSVIDLSAVPYDVVPMVAAQIGRLAYEFNFWNVHCREFPLFLVCEEAHEYIPREDIPRYREARRSMERIAKNGRKYGVGLCVVSQRPHDVSETVLAQCGSFICMRLSNPEDQEYVRSMVPEAARGTFAALTSLAKGEAVALGEAVPMPVRFRVDMPDPPPNSTDIEYAEKWRLDTVIDVNRLVNNWHAQER